MNLKVGDKLLCKKDFIIKYNRYHREVLCDNFYSITKWDLSNLEHEEIKIGSIWFTNHGVWDYFYTPQEARKLKLKQLDDKIGT